MSTTESRYLFTSRGIERLQRRIAEARAAYQSVCSSNPEAREAGDSSVWHDNFAFEENQRQMHQLARRVRDLENVLARAEVVPVPRMPSRVTVGARARYRIDGEPRERTAVLAGWDDGEPAAQRLSYNSPLGSALLGAMVDDEREVVIGGRLRTVTVISIEAMEDV